MGVREDVISEQEIFNIDHKARSRFRAFIIGPDRQKLRDFAVCPTVPAI